MASEEAEEVYTEEEANEAMSLIQEHGLPMSDLQYALKYVRILNQGGSWPQDPKELKVPQAPVAEVEPPELAGNNEEILNDFVIQDF